MPADANAATIFVSIASYRDPDCKNTVQDLLSKAAHAARVIIGVCLQVVPGDDDDCLLSQAQQLYDGQIRVMHVHASESRGACWARHQVQSLFRDEDYYLQVDSHMRFVQDWDLHLLDMLEQCPTEKAVLSTYPLSFTPPDTFAADGIVTIHPKSFNDDGILAQRSTLASMKHAPETPAPVYLIGAGLIFARGKLVREVPYDPYLYFEGEEISLAVRFWTHGWDIFTPNQVVAWHDYGKRPGRSRHWKDQTDWGALNSRSLARIAHMLGVKQSARTEYLQDIAEYGLGTQRSLAQYEAASGIDFAAHMYRNDVLVAPEHAAEHESQITARRDMFTRIWLNNAWRCAETRSGNGSSLGETVALRKWLPHTLRSLGCTSLADAGCGDLNWIKEIVPQLRFYFGYDIVPGLIGDLRQRFHEQRNCFFSEVDIVMQGLASADVILCRDVLTHLPLDATLKILQHVRNSGAQYFIATTHDKGRNRFIGTGSWYPIDLCAAPFKLGAPRFMFKEGGSKMLGVWAVSDMAD